LAIFRADEAVLMSNTSDCPSACSTNSFAVEMSSSLLPADNVGSLLGAKADDIKRRYVNALEFRHRVQTNLMLTTVNQLLKIVDRQRLLKDYLYFVAYDSGTSVANRVSIAIQHFIDLVKNDIAAASKKFFDIFIQVSNLHVYE
jgi:hypothetical protein